MKHLPSLLKIELAAASQSIPEDEEGITYNAFNKIVFRRFHLEPDNFCKLYRVAEL